MDEMNKSFNKGNESYFSLEDFAEKSVTKKYAVTSDDEIIQKALKQMTADSFSMNIEDFDRSSSMRSFLQILKDKKLIETYDLDVPIDDLSRDKVIEISKKSFPIGLDEDSGDVFYVDHEGEKKFLNFDFIDDKMHRKSISELLDDVTFDVLQNGDIRKAKEAEAIYKVCQVNNIYSGLYTNEIKNSLAGYDFVNLRPRNGVQSFADLLRLILEESSSVTNIIMAACNIKLVDLKTKKDLRLLTNISDQEDQELKALKLRILNLRNDYQPLIEKQDTKARREVKREELRKEEVELIKSSPVGVIYEILNLNTESIPNKPRILIARYAKTVAFALKNENQLDIDDDKVLKIAIKMQRRGYREYLSEVKDSLLKAYHKGESVEVRVKR